MKLKVPYHRQSTDFTCGPAAARMILSFWGQRVSERRLRVLLNTNSRSGTRRPDLARGLRSFGLRVRTACNANVSDLRRSLAAGRPAIVNYREPEEGISHYAVVIGLENGKLILNDPDLGSGYRLGMKDFTSRWYGRHRRRNVRWLLVAAPEDK
ncbi:MAG: papain-like cysteine protease family protein [Patescibacteria group bacterium]|jgi:predicted double-glycine peptidase